MKNKLVWRLSKLPTVEELLQLINAKLLTEDEAKEILFKTENDDERDKDSLKSEIKFLRELVDKLSNRTQIVEVIKEVQRPYYRREWYKPYDLWCSNDTVTFVAGTSEVSNQVKAFDSSTSDFTDIKTF